MELTARGRVTPHYHVVTRDEPDGTRGAFSTRASKDEAVEDVEELTQAFLSGHPKTSQSRVSDTYRLIFRDGADAYTAIQAVYCLAGACELSRAR